MKIELRKLSEIKPYPNNPRLNDDAVEAVAASIREFGFRQPIVVDAEGVIVVGHTRYKAALKLGLEMVPVHVATDLTPEQIKAYRIADNKSAELSDWNYDLLPIELVELQGMNYDLGLLGFDQDELAKLLDPGVKDGLCDPDEVPEPPDEAITQPGDLWILDNHRLLCGDSSNPADVDRLLGEASIHLVNTDPPYNVKVEPRSNNAIAAGLSSFPATKQGAIDAAPNFVNVRGGMHHQGFDLARDRTKSKPTTKKPGEPGDVSPRVLSQRLRFRRGVRRAARRLVRQHGPRAGARPRLHHLGRLRQPGQRVAVPQEARAVLLARHRLGQAASRSHPQGFAG
jgi:hypothetical protein